MNDNVTPGGEDTIHCSFYCGFTPKFYDSLEKIAEARDIAEHPVDVRNENEEVTEPVFQCGERYYVVHPSGFAPDKVASRYCYYKYRLEEGGIVIGIQPRECKAADEVCEEGEQSRSRPNVRVEVGSLALIMAGSMENIMPEVEQRLREMGLIILKNRLARVDACVDIPVHIGALQKALLEGRIITRADSKGIYTVSDDDAFDWHNITASAFIEQEGVTKLHFKGRKCTGFTIGKDKIMCRGYDKLEKEKNREEMLEALRIRRGGGEMPTNLSRVEFQVRREALRGFVIQGNTKATNGIETWQDWVMYKAAITQYLCSSWLVFTGSDFDRTHTDRLTVDDWHDDWRMAADAFKQAFGSSVLRVTRLKGVIKRKAKAAIAQAIGNDQSAILKTSVPLSPEDPNWVEKVALFRYASTHVHFSEKKNILSFWQNWKDKVLRMDASVPDDCLSSIVPVANRGVGVTHIQPLDQIFAILSDDAGASGPAPACIG